MCNDYFNNVLLPIFRNYLNIGVYFLVHNLDGDIEFITDECAQFFTKKSVDELIGSNFYKLGIINLDEFIAHADITKRAISEKRVIRFINVSTNNSQSNHLKKDLSHNVYFCSVLPLFDLSGQTIGTVTVGLPFKNFNFDLFHYLTGTLDQPRPNAEKTIEKLSPREFEVLYLLSKGMSQREVATFLGISRGTVSKLITDGIYYKLGLSSQYSDTVVRRAIRMGIDREVPRSLLKPQIIVLS